jgi:hypothetical protein
MPAVISAPDADLDSLGDLCGRMADAGVRIVLHELDRMGVLQPVRAWWPEGMQTNSIEGEVVEEGGYVEEPTATVAIESVKVEEDADDQDDENDDDREVLTSNCFSCKQQRTFHADAIKTQKNGTRIATGKCDVCGKGMSKFLPKLVEEDADDDGEAEALSRVRAEAAKREGDTVDEPDDEDESDDEPSSDRDEMVDVVGAAVNAATEGMPADEAAEVTQAVAIEFSNVAEQAEAISLTDEEKEEVPTTGVTGQVGVAECFQCHTMQPVIERAGIRVFVQHSSEGNPRCKGSSSVVQ